MNISNDTSNKDMRDAFFDEIYLSSMDNKNIVVITNDMDIFSLRELKTQRPNQFINVGVAEQNMINIASGLASMGMKVIIYGIAPFVVYRCYEQIKFNICSMNLPVTIVGIGSGLSFAFDGPTHHAIQDISVMSALPEMQILNPSDSASAKYCSDLVLNSESPFYVRMDKGIHPKIHDLNKYEPFKIIKQFNNNVILSSGTIINNVIDSVKDKDIGIIDVISLKPFPEQIFDIIKDVENVIIIEEHSVTGGLGSIFSDQANILNLNFNIHLIGFENKQILEYGSREWFYNKSGLDVKSLTKSIDNILNG
ncbi:MAG: hypothetical protein CL708_04615 [Chloroflexi bacterium]|nr:hypothetical protein [Chloroflexota bacterium]MDC0047181.1 hypothetical protein [Chloroflexota bacterium]|tara:strand:+ start:262 stop:1188 length:927 start_codon:yes stop_codon:yes gene_type:complete